MLELNISQTRVKKFKNYRKKIQNEYLIAGKNDELKQISKLVAKYDPLLVLNEHKFLYFNPYQHPFLAWNDHFVLIKQYLKHLKSYDFAGLYTQITSLNAHNNITALHPLYSEGLVWLQEDANYHFLIQNKNWFNLMLAKEGEIMQKIKDHLFVFEQAVAKTKNTKFCQSVLLPKNQPLKMRKNNLNKKLFWGLIGTFFVCLLLAFCFLFLFYFS